MDYNITKRTRMKNRVRIKLLACFKPVVSDEQPLFSSAISSDNNDEGGGGRKAVQRSFSSTMKAAFFRSLVKKIGGRKSRQDSYRSNNSLSSSKSEKCINPMKKKSCHKGFSDHDQETSITNSNRSSLFSLASPSSASSFSSSSASETVKELTSPDLKRTNTKNKQRALSSDACRSIYNSTSSGMFVILVCLAALVLWGKAFAIVVCTSTWLFLAPSCQPRAVDTQVNDIVFDSVEHKKRVVMEGLLQRDRPRVL